MKARWILPALCLGGAFVLLVPTRSSRAFDKLGGFLSENQRDVRVFDNFADSFSNNNVTPSFQFPGQLGAELAIWKGITEWGSILHNNGAGDPVSGNLLGSGGANFDAFFAGAATGPGTTNQNVVSTVPNCGGGGTLAFTETPISDGWRIIYCDEWTWDDGPAGLQGRWDIQGVMAHEYGHALGLGHSGVSGTTMFPSASAGQTSLRSIALDDMLGIQCIYLAIDPAKPTIVSTVGNAGAGTLTIFGTNFGATGNEVWFRSAAATSPAVDPIVRVTGVTSDGTVITVPVPAGAGPGDVMVNVAGTGGATLSNAFPTNLTGTFGAPPVPRPDLTSVTPATIEALIPGTAQTILLGGVDLDLTTAVLLDGIAIDPARYTVLGPTSISLDMPQASSLGAHSLAVTDGLLTDTFAVTIVEPATPRYQVGTGDPLNVIDKDDGLDFIISGTVGQTHAVYSSTSNLPSTSPFVTLDIGNDFTDIALVGNFTIPASGWLQVHLPPLRDPGPTGKTFYSQSFALRFPAPFPTSNLQSIHVVQ